MQCVFFSAAPIATAVRNTGENDNVKGQAKGQHKGQRRRRASGVQGSTDNDNQKPPPKGVEKKKTFDLRSNNNNKEKGVAGKHLYCIYLIRYGEI